MDFKNLEIEVWKNQFLDTIQLPFFLPRRKQFDPFLEVYTLQVTLEAIFKVNVYYGTVIPEAAVEIQRQVIEQVESAAGVTVAAVDVIVQQLDDIMEEDDDETDDGNAALAAGQAAVMAGMPNIG